MKIGVLQAIEMAIPALVQSVDRKKHYLYMRRCDADPRSVVLEYLEPLKEIVATGKILAERCIENWNGSLMRSPAIFVETYRIK